MPNGESPAGGVLIAALPCGRPFAASRSRSAARSAAGTMIEVPSLPSLYTVSEACSSCAIAAASFWSSPAYSRPEFGPRDHSTTATPSATAAATATSNTSWRAAGLRVICLRESRRAPLLLAVVAMALSAMLLLVGQGCSVIGASASDRHVHDVLVGVVQLVLHRHRGAHREIRLLHRDHGAAQVGAGIATLEARGHVARLDLAVAHRGDGLPQQRGEIRRAAACRRLHRGLRHAYLRRHLAHLGKQVADVDRAHAAVSMPMGGRRNPVARRVCRR